MRLTNGSAAAGLEESFFSHLAQTIVPRRRVDALVVMVVMVGEASHVTISSASERGARFCTRRNFLPNHHHRPQKQLKQACFLHSRFSLALSSECSRPNR